MVGLLLPGFRLGGDHRVVVDLAVLYNLLLLVRFDLVEEQVLEVVLGRVALLAVAVRPLDVLLNLPTDLFIVLGTHAHLLLDG